MRTIERSRTRGGFTLTELMITVALIGTICSDRDSELHDLSSAHPPQRGIHQPRRHRARVQGLPRRAGPLSPTCGGRPPFRLPEPGSRARRRWSGTDRRGVLRRSSAGGPMATSSTPTRSSPIAVAAAARIRPASPSSRTAMSTATTASGAVMYVHPLTDSAGRSRLRRAPSSSATAARTRTGTPSTTSPPSIWASEPISTEPMAVARGLETRSRAAERGRTVALVRARRVRHGARARVHAHALGGGERAAARAEPGARAPARVRLRARDRGLLLDPGAPARGRRAAPRRARRDGRGADRPRDRRSTRGSTIPTASPRCGSPTSYEQVRHANRLLEKAIAYHPLDWRNHFYLGYNHFFYLEDNATRRGRARERAALPGCAGLPGRVRGPAARVAATASIPRCSSSSS